MLNVAVTVTTLVSTSKVSAIVVLMFLLVLAIHYVAGSRGQQVTMHCKVNDAITTILRDLHETNRANDVLYTQHDVINDQVPCPSHCDCSW